MADWIARQPETERRLAERLRAIALAAAPDVSEHVKWNAPSFCVAGDDRITLGLERAGGLRVVVHRGARAKDATAFEFADPDQVMSWPARDRGLARFADVAELTIREDAVADLFARWLASTRA